MILSYYKKKWTKDEKWLANNFKIKFHNKKNCDKVYEQINLSHFFRSKEFHSKNQFP